MSVKNLVELYMLVYSILWKSVPILSNSCLGLKINQGSSKAGLPQPPAGPVRHLALQQEGSFSVMPLNHPQTIPPPSPQAVEKLSSTNRSPVLKRLGTAGFKGCVIYMTFLLPQWYHYLE